MFRRPPVALLALTIAAAVFALGAAAATRPSRPVDSPDLASMALALSDLPSGARISAQGYNETEAVAEYERVFTLRGARVGKSRLEQVLNLLFVDANAGEASSEFAELNQLLATKSARNQLKSAFASEFANDPTLKSIVVTIGRPRHAAIGDGAVSVLIRLSGKKKLTLDVVLTFVREDRVIGLLGFTSVVRGHVAAADRKSTRLNSSH